MAVSPDGTRAYVTNYASDTVSAVALRPSAPRSVVATAGDGQVGVSWDAPTFTGGQPITGYTATALPGGKTCTTDGPTGCTITGLTNGTSYTVTVTATNSIGTSLPSAPGAPVTPTVPPVTPTTPPVTPTTPPVAPALQEQTASVKVPKKIKSKGKTVLLNKAVRTNAAQKAKSKVTVKPKAEEVREGQNQQVRQGHDQDLRQEEVEGHAQTHRTRDQSIRRLLLHQEMDGQEEEEALLDRRDHGTSRCPV